MSVCNLVVQQDAAYLVTDEGYFSEDGCITHLLPKSIVIEGLPIVIGATGSGIALPTVAISAAALFDSANFTLDRFRDLVRATYSNRDLDPIRHKTRWAVAYYSREARQARGFTLYTDPGDADGKPWRWHNARVLVMPYVEPIDVWGENVKKIITDPAVFDPLRDSMKFVHAQRAKRDCWGDMKGCGVAGQIRLSKVSAAGLEEFLLHDYGDRIGEPAGSTR